MKRIILIGIISLLFSCNNTKEFNAANILNIRFGTGGGYTGEITTYEISSEGHLNIIVQHENKFLRKLNKKFTRQIFDEAYRLKSYKFNEPDNIYAFLEIFSLDTINKISWGVGSTAVSADVTKLHDKLISLTK